MFNEKTRLFRNNYAVSFEAINAAALRDERYLENLKADIGAGFGGLDFLRKKRGNKGNSKALSELRSLAQGRLNGSVPRAQFKVRLKSICRECNLPPNFVDNLLNRIESTERLNQNDMRFFTGDLSVFGGVKSRAVPNIMPLANRLDGHREKTVRRLFGKNDGRVKKFVPPVRMNLDRLFGGKR